jgi:predicted TIM-barrel fold metal-dependent hydrolase
MPLADCHAYIVDPDRFPFAPGHGYRPLAHENGPREAFAATLAGAGVTHALLVQPSCYGYDNTALFDALARSGGRFRAIVVVPLDASSEQLAGMVAAGAVGVRFNLVSHRGDTLEDPRAPGFLARIRALGWHAEVFAHDEQWPVIAPVLREAGVRVLVDHFGIRDPAADIASPGFRAVLALGRDGLATVKLAEAFRTEPALLVPFADALLAEFGPERCVWGSDWPFLNMADRPSYAGTLETLSRFVHRAEDRARILWDTPTRLFGFDDTM